jgi:hypothetical protein
MLTWSAQKNWEEAFHEVVDMWSFRFFVTQKLAKVTNRNGTGERFRCVHVELCDPAVCVARDSLPLAVRGGIR